MNEPSYPGRIAISFVESTGRVEVDDGINSGVIGSKDKAAKEDGGSPHGLDIRGVLDILVHSKDANQFRERMKRASGQTDESSD